MARARPKCTGGPPRPSDPTALRPYGPDQPPVTYQPAHRPADAPTRSSRSAHATLADDLRNQLAALTAEWEDLTMQLDAQGAMS